MTKTSFNISEVARITGKSRTTIYKDIKADKMSYDRGEDGKIYIVGAELARIYKDIDFSRLEARQEEPQEAKPQPQQKTDNNLLLENSLIKQENDYLKQSLEELKSQLAQEKERRNKADDRLYETQQQTQRLLEDKRKKGLFGRLWGG